MRAPFSPLTYRAAATSLARDRCNSWARKYSRTHTLVLHAGRYLSADTERVSVGISPADFLERRTERPFEHVSTDAQALSVLCDASQSTIGHVETNAPGRFPGRSRKEPSASRAPSWLLHGPFPRSISATRWPRRIAAVAVHPARPIPG